MVMVMVYSSHKQHRINDRRKPNITPPLKVLLPFGPVNETPRNKVAQLMTPVTPIQLMFAKCKTKSYELNLQFLF